MLQVNGKRYYVSRKAKKLIGVGLKISKFKKQKQRFPFWLEKLNTRYAMLNIGANYEIHKSNNRLSRGYDPETEISIRNVVKRVKADLVPCGYHEATNIINGADAYFPMQAFLQIYGYTNLEYNNAAEDQRELCRAICKHFKTHPSRYDSHELVNFFLDYNHLLDAYDDFCDDTAEPEISKADILFYSRQISHYQYSGVLRRLINGNYLVITLALIISSEGVPWTMLDPLMDNDASNIVENWGNYNAISNILINAVADDGDVTHQSDIEIAQMVYKKYLLANTSNIYPLTSMLHTDVRIQQSWIKARQNFGISRWKPHTHYLYPKEIKQNISVLLLCLYRMDASPGIMHVFPIMCDMLSRHRMLWSSDMVDYIM